jgi:hypothetical protein
VMDGGPADDIIKLLGVRQRLGDIPLHQPCVRRPFDRVERAMDVGTDVFKAIWTWIGCQVAKQVAEAASSVVDKNVARSGVTA